MKPIIFNTQMVQAILYGRKTCTRRPVKPQPPQGWFTQFDGNLDDLLFFTEHNWDDDMMGWFPSYDKGIKPQYQVGDILYVRETWRESYKNAAFEYEYRADPERDTDEYTPFTWRPSIHMPKEAARIFLKVIGVRVERVQDITDEEAKKEGISIVGTNMSRLMHKLEFARLWTSIYNNWGENPWVWVYDFERCEKPTEQYISNVGLNSRRCDACVHGDKDEFDEPCVVCRPLVNGGYSGFERK